MRTTRYAPEAFEGQPIGDEALPPDGSPYHRAIHLPQYPGDPTPWALISGSGDRVKAEWRGSLYLSASDFEPAERVSVKYVVASATDLDGPLQAVLTVTTPTGNISTAWEILNAFSGRPGENR